MASLDREVELQIKAQDFTSKTISDVRKSLRQLRDDLAKQAKAAKSGTADLKSYEASLKGLEAAANQLSSLRSQIVNLQSLESKYKKLNDTLTTLRANEAALAQSIGQSGVATKAQIGALAGLNKKITTTAQALDRTDTAINKQRLFLQQYGVDVRHLASANEHLARLQRGAYNSMIQARNHTAKLTQTNHAAAQAAANHAAAQAALAAHLKRVAQAAADTKAAQAAAQAAQAAARREQLLLQGSRLAINAKRESLLKLIEARRKAVQSQQTLSENINRALNPTKKFVATMEDTRRTIARTRTLYRDFANDSAKLKAATEKLAIAQKRLVGMAQVVDEYQRVRKAMRDAKSEYDALRQKQMQLNAAMRGGRATAAQVADLQKTVAAMNQVGAVYARYRVQSESLQATLRQNGISTNNLAQTQLRLVNAARASAQSMNNLQTALSRLNGVQHRVNSSWLRGINSSRTSLDVFQRLRGQILAVTSAYIGLYGAIDLFNKVIQAGKDGYKLKVSAEILEDGDWAKAIGGDMEKYFRETAERMGLSLQDVVQDATKFFVAAKESGRSVKEAAYTWEQFTGFGKLLGLDNVTMGRVSKALEQMFSKGTVSAEELKQQLGDALPAATALFAKALGVTTGELMDMLKQGEVSADTLILAAHEIDKKYGTLIAKTFDNLQSAQNRMANAWQDWLRLINDAGVSDNFKELIVEVTAFLRSDDGKKWAANFATAINAVIDALRWCVKNVDFLIGAFSLLFSLLAVQAFVSVTKGVLVLAGSLGRLVGVFSNLFLHIGRMVGVLPATATAVGGLSGVFTVLLAVLKRIFLPVALLVGALQALWEVFELGTDASDIFRQIGDAAFALGAVLEIVSKVFKTAFKGAVLIVKNAFSYLFSFVKSIFQRFGFFSKTKSNEFADTWGDSINVLEDGFSRFVFKAMGYLDKLIAYSKSAMTYLGGLVDVVFGDTKLEDLSFEKIHAESMKNQRESGYQKEYLDRVKARQKEKAEAAKNEATASPDISGLSGKKDSDDEKEREKKAKAAARMQQELERQRERVERERTKAEQAALKRLEKQLEYQKALDYYSKSAFGRFKNGQDNGNYADYMKGQYTAMMRKYAALREQDRTYLDSLAASREEQIKKLEKADAAAKTSSKVAASSAAETGGYSMRDRQMTAAFEKLRSYWTGSRKGELKGACAEGVRMGIEAAFGKRIGGQGHANELIGNLIRNGHAKRFGYKEIAFDPKTYVPKVGDIMSLSSTSTKKGRWAGHVGFRGIGSWYADGKQNNAIGNTIAFLKHDYKRILNGDVKVRVLRLTDKAGNDIPLASKGGSVASQTKQVHNEHIEAIKEFRKSIAENRQESAFESNKEQFFERAEELQERINNNALEAVQKLLSENGLTIDAAVNMASIEVSLNNQLPVGELEKAFKEAYQPSFDKQAKEVATLLYARLHEKVGAEQARRLIEQIEPKIRALYAEKAKEELGKLIEQRFDATVGEAQKHITARENQIKALQAQLLNGALTPEQAANKMLEFQKQNTQEIKKQIDAIDAFIASANGKVDAGVLAKLQAQREALAVNLGNGGIGQPNAQREAMDDFAEVQIKRINDLLSARTEIEKQQALSVQAGMATVQQANAVAESQYQRINNELRDLIANSEQAQAVMGDMLSPEKLTAWLQSVVDGKSSLSEMIGYAKVLKQVGAELTRGFQVMFEAAAKGVAGLITGQKTLAETFTDLRNAFLGWVSEFLMNIAKMILQQAILTALQAAAEKNPAGSGIIGTIIQGAIAALGGVTANVKHGGGIVGQGRKRDVNPSVFANAPRYHSGGIVGMKPNEVPAILERGEEVLTKSDPRHRNNVINDTPAWGEKEPEINVIVTFDANEALAQSLASRTGQNILVNALGKQGQLIRNLGR